MKPKLSDLWRWDGTFERGPFLFWGILLFAIEYNLDRLIGNVWFDQNWGFFNLDTLRFYLWQAPMGQMPNGCYLTLLIASLPFLWTRVGLTLRRLRSLGWRPWWVLLLIVPFLKLFFFLLLCLLPSRQAATPMTASNSQKTSGLLGAWIPQHTLGSAALAVAITAILGTAAVWLGASLLGDYGWSIFAGLPFAMGFLSVLIYTHHTPRTLRSCVLTAMAAIGLAGAALLVAATEGVICLIMAAPIALALGIIGGITGYLIQDTIWRRAQSARLFCTIFLAIPTAMEIEHAIPPPLPELKVQSSVIINAPPEKVWKNVISFSQLPPPTEAIFKLGVAYPIRAEIDGQGVGAIRRCNFSTGPFVEPIEVWDEPHLLKFSVTQNPEPMQEWTPYRSIHPRHLDGYLQSCGGQFRLVALPGNRTLLEGTTWYYHHLWPAGYWQLWSDQIIHTIHLRVLNHVKQLSEAK